MRKIISIFFITKYYPVCIYHLHFIYFPRNIYHDGGNAENKNAENLFPSVMNEKNEIENEMVIYTFNLGK